MLVQILTGLLEILAAAVVHNNVLVVCTSEKSEAEGWSPVRSDSLTHYHCILSIGGVDYGSSRH